MTNAHAAVQQALRNGNMAEYDFWGCRELQSFGIGLEVAVREQLRYRTITLGGRGITRTTPVMDYS